MRDVHPHWHTTQDDAERAGPVAEPVSAQPRAIDTVMPVGAVAVSRKPAAVVGILVVLAIGYSLFQGLGGLLGQLTNDDTVTIRITSAGFTPETVTARPGQKVVWRNEDAIPHIVYSDMIQMGPDEPFQTSPIFKDGEAEFVMPLTINPGEYTYASRTKSEFTGTIVVEIPAPAASSSASSEEQSSAPAAPPIVPPAVSSASSSSSEAFAFPPAPFPNDDFPPYEEPQEPTVGIPQNPYTIDSNVIPNPSMSGQVTSRAPLLQQAKGKPLSQPESGPATTAIWVVGALSGVLLLATTRKAFAA